MSTLDWGKIQDGGVFESLMHALLYAEDPGTIQFGRPGPDAGLDARSADGCTVYQAKYRHGMTMDKAIKIAKAELDKIKKYQESTHPNYRYWQSSKHWVLVSNLPINAKDVTKWQDNVIPLFQQSGLIAEYWDIPKLNDLLSKHPEICDVYFEGENRVLVGLKEAYDLLSSCCKVNASYDQPMIGREAELRTVLDFAESTEKQILPIVGPGGSGKSHLLYESLVKLGNNGWRVLWALPATMARSSRWFHLLNGNQPTCVAIDCLEDPSILRVIIEQLETVERRNWKVILACRSEKAEVLRRFQNNNHVAKNLSLLGLDEQASKQLLQTITEFILDEAWMHTVYTHTHGIPGWLCLIAQLLRHNSLMQLPENIDKVADLYVNSCIEVLDIFKRDKAQILLHWLALWGNLSLNEDKDKGEICFLAKQGIPVSTVRNLLCDLVNIGLVHNWGIDKRFYAVEPLIIREYILSNWLLREESGTYRVNLDGKDIVLQLVRGTIPNVDSILKSLSQITRSRLHELERVPFLKPIFDEMLTLAKDGTVLDQGRIIDLVDKVGAADPESALDVIVTIHNNYKEDMTVDISPWGSQTFTHANLMAKLPQILYQFAECVYDIGVARRYLEEFRALVELDQKSTDEYGESKKVQDLLRRLLCRPINFSLYLSVAVEILDNELDIPSAWPFVGLLLESLLNPEREWTEWVSKWTMCINTKTIEHGTHEWKLTSALRVKVLDMLQTSTNSCIRFQLWHILSNSHHQFHRMVHQGKVHGDTASRYREILVNDLTKCAAILNAPPVTLTLEEGTHAREIWSWYLKYGRMGDPIDLARECETIYNNLSKWRLHEFFRFDSEDVLGPETNRIANILQTTEEIGTFTNFFSESKRYLITVRPNLNDSADWSRIAALVEALGSAFSPSLTNNILTLYVKNVLAGCEEKNELSWYFATKVCQKHLRLVKKKKDVGALSNEIRYLLDLTHNKSRFLYDIYSSPHPVSIGELTVVELDYVLEWEHEFSEKQWFYLLGGFIVTRSDTVKSCLYAHLTTMKSRPVEANVAMKNFIIACELSALRFGWLEDQIPTEWIMTMITEFELDGALLEMYQLTWIRDNSNFKFSTSQLAEFIRSRISLENKPKPYNSFKIMPHNFKINEWCFFDATNTDDIRAFHAICDIALGSTFTAIYWMQKYVAKLDISGQQVAAFVEKYLFENPSNDVKELSRIAYLASAYPDTSEAWKIIAFHICKKAQGLRREERAHVYFGLSRKETGVIISSPGSVPQYYVQVYDEAKTMLNAEPQDSPLRGYREWKVRSAEADLRREQGFAEEYANESS